METNTNKFNCEQNMTFYGPKHWYQFIFDSWCLWINTSIHLCTLEPMNGQWQSGTPPYHFFSLYLYLHIFKFSFLYFYSMNKRRATILPSFIAVVYTVSSQCLRPKNLVRNPTIFFTISKYVNRSTVFFTVL